MLSFNASQLSPGSDQWESIKKGSWWHFNRTYAYQDSNDRSFVFTYNIFQRFLVTILYGGMESFLARKNCSWIKPEEIDRRIGAIARESGVVSSDDESL